jgi:hypothetical protein
MGILYSNIKNINKSNNFGENGELWYKGRTREEINRNYKYCGGVEIDNKYLDIYFEVSKQYWDDFKNKQKNQHSKIINKEYYGYILEREYTYVSYYTDPHLRYVYFIVKRYII